METCRSVIICEIIVHLLVTVQNELMSSLEGLNVIHEGKWMMGVPGSSKILVQCVPDFVALHPIRQTVLKVN